MKNPPAPAEVKGQEEYSGMGEHEKAAHPDESEGAACRQACRRSETYFFLQDFLQQPFLGSDVLKTEEGLKERVVVAAIFISSPV